MRQVAMSVLATLCRERRLTRGLWATCAGLGLDPLGCSATSQRGCWLGQHPVVIRLVTLPSYIPRAELAVTAATVFAEYEMPRFGYSPLSASRCGPVSTCHRGQVAPPSGSPPGGAWFGPGCCMRCTRCRPSLNCRAGILTDFDNRVRHTPRWALQTASSFCAAAPSWPPRSPSYTSRSPRACSTATRTSATSSHGPNGPLLCDLGSCAIGPLEWDLPSVAVAEVRFHPPAGPQQDFITNYGFDSCRRSSGTSPAVVWAWPMVCVLGGGRRIGSCGFVHETSGSGFIVRPVGGVGGLGVFAGVGAGPGCGWGRCCRAGFWWRGTARRRTGGDR